MSDVTMRIASYCLKEAPMDSNEWASQYLDTVNTLRFEGPGTMKMCHLRFFGVDTKQYETRYEDMKI